jgi:capsular exopolysaccharide synthesis family protein
MELRRYWEIIVRRKWTLILSVLLVPVFTAAFLKIYSPIYSSEAKIWVLLTSVEHQFVTDLPSKVGDIGFSKSDNAMGTMEEMLKSKSSIGRVIKEMGLRDKHGKNYIQADFINPNKVKLLLQKTGVTIENTADSDVFVITGYSKDAAISREIADKVSKAFFDTFAEMYRKEARKALRAIELRRADVQNRLLVAERDLQEYKTKNELFDTSEQIKSLVSEIADLESKKKLDQETNIARLMIDNTPEHPDVKAAQQQLDAVKEQIETRRKIFNRVAETDRTAADLSRKVTNLKQVYNTLAINSETARTAIEMDLSNVFEFQPATMAEQAEDNQYFPPKKKKVWILASGLLGLLLGTFFLYLHEYVDENLWSPRETESSLNLKVIGTVPLVKKSERKIENLESSRLTESIHNLVSTVKLSKGSDPGKVISLVSVSRKEGKSLLGAYIAGVMASKNRKVLLIDGNLRSPSLDNIYNVPVNKGLSDYLQGKIAFDDAVHASTRSTPDIVTSGSLPLTNPQKYLASERFSDLMKEAKARYDVIVLDTPAAKEGSDALIISKHADDIYFVVGQGKTNKQAARDFVYALERAKITVFGVLLNKVKKGNTLS